METGFVVFKNGKYAEVPLTEEEFRQLIKFIEFIRQFRDDLEKAGYFIPFGRIERLLISKNNLKSIAKIRLRYNGKEIYLKEEELRDLYDIAWEFLEEANLGQRARVERGR